MFPVDVALLRTVSLASAGVGNHAGLPVLLYHRVLPRPDPLCWADPDAARFDRDMALLSKVFTVLPLEEAVTRLLNATLPRRAAAITFDDGYRDNLEVAAPILRKHGLTATFFIASGFLNGGRMFNDTVTETIRRLPSGDIDLSWIGLGVRTISDMASRAALIGQFNAAIKYLSLEARQEASDRLGHRLSDSLPNDLMMTDEGVRTLARGGMTIGGHTVTHPILARVSSDEAMHQIRQNRADLTAIVGHAPTLFAFPNGKPGRDYTDEHALMARQAGYSAAFAVGGQIAWSSADRFQIPRISSQAASPTRLAARMLYHAAWWRRPRAGAQPRPV